MLRTALAFLLLFAASAANAVFYFQVDNCAATSCNVSWSGGVAGQVSVMTGQVTGSIGTLSNLAASGTATINIGAAGLTSMSAYASVVGGIPLNAPGAVLLSVFPLCYTPNTCLVSGGTLGTAQYGTPAPAPAPASTPAPSGGGTTGGGTTTGGGGTSTGSAGVSTPLLDGTAWK